MDPHRTGTWRFRIREPLGVNSPDHFPGTGISVAERLARLHRDPVRRFADRNLDRDVNAADGRLVTHGRTRR